ncbi:MAG: enolase C-terminal domain-like protein [Acidimicrobiia bacterium]
MNAPTSTDAPVVERLDVSTYRVPLPEAHSDGTLSWDSVTAVVVHAHGGGRCGLGLTYGPAACATLIEELLVPVVERRRVDAVAGSWAAMVRAIRNAGRPGVSSMAIAAVDIALWDLLARNLDVPLDAVLGRVRDRVAVYGSGGFTSLDDAALAEQLGGWVHHDGMARVKMKIAAGWGADERRDLERVALARSTIGDAGLFVDANGGYGTKQALQVGGALEQLGVTCDTSSTSPTTSWWSGRCSMGSWRCTTARWRPKRTAPVTVCSSATPRPSGIASPRYRSAWRGGPSAGWLR